MSDSPERSPGNETSEEFWQSLVQAAGRVAPQLQAWLESDESLSQFDEFIPPEPEPPATSQRLTPRPIPRSQVAAKQRDWKQLYEEIRNLSLEDLAIQFGLERDRYDKHKWRGAGQIISINDQKFYDHLNEKGGVGAIDFTMHVQQLQTPKAVVEMLSQRSQMQSIPSRPAPVEAPAKAFVLPTINESNWQAVKNYLVGERGLPAGRIEQLHQLGILYADDRRNAVFVRHKTENWTRSHATGATLRGTISHFKGLAPGSKRDQGYFWYGVGKGDLQRVVLVESAIDAISYDTLHPATGKTIYLSTDGADAIPLAELRAVVAQGGVIELALDADAAGDQMADRICSQLPEATRTRSHLGKDWNEQLKVTRAGNTMDTLYDLLPRTARVIQPDREMRDKKQAQTELEPDEEDLEL